MKWTIEYSRHADRFIQAEGIEGEVRSRIEGFIRKLRGEPTNTALSSTLLFFPLCPLLSSLFIFPYSTLDGGRSMFIFF